MSIARMSIESRASRVARASLGLLAFSHGPLVGSARQLPANPVNLGLPGALLLRGRTGRLRPALA